MRKLFTSLPAVEAVKTVLHLPLVARLSHKKSRRTVWAISTGVSLMVVGSVVASERHEIAEALCGHHIFWDALGYFLHAVGAVPALRHIEPLWLLLFGLEE